MLVHKGDERPYRLAIPVVLVLAAVAAYWPLWRNGFSGSDDTIYITGNCMLRKGLCLETIRWAFEFSAISYWHPVTWLSLLADYDLFGLNPVGFHLVNLCLHAANALLLFLFLRRSTRRLWESAGVALLFALHPLNVEAVVWAVERKTVLSTFFALLALHAYGRYVRRPGPRRMLPVLVTFALGLMAKAMIVTLPFLLLLLDYWPLGRFVGDGDGAPAPAWRLLLEKVPLFGLSAASATLSVLSVRGIGGTAELVGTPMGERLTNAAVSYAAYLGKLFWPVDLAIFYPLRDHYPVWQWVGAVLLLGVVTVAALRSWRRSPWFAVGWCWYLGVMLPAIGLVRGGVWPAMADRFAYLPFIGLFLVLSWEGGALVRKYSLPPLVPAVITTAAGLLLICATYRQTTLWRSPITLFSHALEVSGESVMTCGGLGVAYFEAGEYDKALPLLRRVGELDPDSPDYEIAQGRIAWEKRNLPLAAEWLNKALRKRDDEVETLYYLGLVHEGLGEHEQAVRDYGDLLVSRQPDSGCYRDKAQERRRLLVERRLSSLEGARRAVAANPADIGARLELATRLDSLGFYAEALPHYLVLERSGVESWQLFASIARDYVRLAETGKAAAYFEKCLGLNPADAGTLNELGIIRRERKRYQEAIALFGQAIALDPTYFPAPYNLAVTYVQAGDRANAVRWLRYVGERFPDYRPRVLPLLAGLERGRGR
jgi:tetratricopeptide (TPR) repeat protein